MAEWLRNTPWRQGHIIPENVARILGIADKEHSSSVVVVVSHDCDLAQLPNLEPEVELIVGRRLTGGLDGNYTYAKNARVLHLTVNRGLNIELIASRKRKIPKERLVDHKPSEEFRLTAAERTILQKWLAARYRRSAFPDEFDARLGGTGLKDRITKILKPCGAWISAVLLDVDEGNELTRVGPDDPYVISFYLLYTVEIDAEAAEVAAKAAAAAITKAFREKCWSKTLGRWQTFELVECEPISDEALSVRQADYLKKLPTDYLSLRVDPPQPMLED